VGLVDAAAAKEKRDGSGIQEQLVLRDDRLREALATTYVVERPVPPGANIMHIITRHGADPAVAWGMPGLDGWFRDLAEADATPAKIQTRLSGLGEQTDAKVLAWIESRHAALRAEVDAAVAWQKPGGMRPNHPPDLAGCPPSALAALRRMLGGTK
jgi:hypothetical protein